MKQAFHISIFLIFVTCEIRAAEKYVSDSTSSKKWYFPHYVPLQFAGNIGLVSTGIGYTSNRENYELNILYGYVPASVAQTYIHTVAVKNIFPLSRYLLRNNQTFVPYFGLGLTLEVGGISFFKMPSHYPKSYYDFPKNLHVTGFGGVKIQHFFRDDVKFIRGIEFYAEAGTMDIYVWYKAISDEIKFNEIFSLAFGINFLLDH